MSNIYIKEPSTNGKVLMKTSVGDIDIELWPREAPIACKNFVQLCLESYYDGLIFHRVVPGFIVQGGDPTGTGTGGESVYGHTFKDEFHSRLRFVRRGLVAMANSGPDDNASQFFFTLGPCNDLNKKHTIFAKVSGDTIYNMIRLGEVATDDNERPINPPFIKTTKVLANPFDDIVPRVTKSKKKAEEKSKKKSKMRATKDFKLLSFGMEAEMDEEETKEFKPKFNSKSSHDLVKDDPTLSSEAVHLEGDEKADDQENVTEEKKEENLDYVKDKLKSKQTPLQKKIQEMLEEDEDNKVKRQNKIEEMQKEQKQIAKELKTNKAKEAKKQKKSDDDDSDSSNSDDGENDNNSNNPLYDDYRKQQKIYRKKTSGNNLKGKSREEQTMLMLSKFQEKLFTNKSKTDKDVTTEKDDWLRHEFVVEQELLRDAKDMNRDITEDRYTLEDPRNPINKRRRGDDKPEKPKRKRR